MGAMVFFILMVFIFCVASFFILLSAVLLIIQKVRRSRGRIVKKRWIVMPVILLVINVMVLIIPIGFVVFIRSANMSNTPKIVYAESGKVIHWPKGEYEPDTNWFKMNDSKYVLFYGGMAESTFFLEEVTNKRGEPVANIRYPKSEGDSFDNAMSLLFAGGTKDQLNVSTIYPIENKNDFVFFEVDGTAGGGIYCLETEQDDLREYYEDLSNYETQDLTCEYALYSKNKGEVPKENFLYTDVKKKVNVNPGVFKELRTILHSEQKVTKVEIPQKYIDLSEAKRPGTPIYGYEERDLYAYSKDKMAFQSVSLVLLDEQVYIQVESGNQYIKGYPLTDEMNQYIRNVVFED